MCEIMLCRAQELGGSLKQDTQERPGILLRAASVGCYFSNGGLVFQRLFLSMFLTVSVHAC